MTASYVCEGSLIAGLLDGSLRTFKPGESVGADQLPAEEIERLRDLGVLRLPAEVLPIEQTQALLDQKDAEIERLRAKLTELAAVDPDSAARGERDIASRAESALAEAAANGELVAKKAAK